MKWQKSYPGRYLLRLLNNLSKFKAKDYNSREDVPFYKKRISYKKNKYIILVNKFLRLFYFL